MELKIKDLRKKSKEELEKLLQKLRFEQSSVYTINKDVRIKDKGLSVRGNAKQGEKTSIKKDLRRSIAKIKTILNER